MPEFKQSSNSLFTPFPITFSQCLIFTIFVETSPLLCSSKHNCLSESHLKQFKLFLDNLVMVSTISLFKKVSFSVGLLGEVPFFTSPFVKDSKTRLSLSNRTACLEVEWECGTQAMCAEKSQVMYAENADFWPQAWCQKEVLMSKCFMLKDRPLWLLV